MTYSISLYKYNILCSKDTYTANYTIPQELKYGDLLAYEPL